MAKPVKAVLVGCGAISNAWLHSATLQDDLEIIGLVDINEQAAIDKAKAHKLTEIATGADLREMLRKVGPDVVFDCTIPEAHVKVTLEALSHGCHVMGEKPLADTMENARKMVDAAKDAGKIYAVIQNRRYQPQIRALRKFLDNGHIGEVTTVNCDFYLGPHFGGFRDRMEHVLLLDMAIHTFDQARLISGADPISVYCKEWNPKGSWYDHDASAIALFEMTNDIVYTYRGSWCAVGNATTWECDWRIMGSKGSVTWNGADAFHAEAIEDNGSLKEIPVTIEANPAFKGGHAGVMHDFLQAVRTGQSPETVCTDNIKSLAMVFGAVESAESGRPTSIRI